MHHPYPKLERDSYILLDGEWDYAIVETSDQDRSFHETMPSSYPHKNIEYQGQINVPYSPETPFSGLAENLKPEQELWYRKRLEIPFSDLVYIRFLAVDWRATLFLNGHYVLMHEGGYTPFEADITPYLISGENTIEVMVRDFQDTCPYARGKQVLKHKGMWYRAQSGIWQSVMLESRKKAHITSFEAKTMFDTSEVEISLTALPEGSREAIIVLDGIKYEVLTNAKSKIKLENPIAWTPDNPHLYTVEIRYEEDVCRSYFAFREVSLKNEKVHLNGKEIFLNGVLDQGYNMGGFYTFSEAEMIQDLKLIKRLGFNTIRKHIKVEAPVYYTLCDEMGILVIQDMVSGGSASPLVSMLPVVLENFSLKDTKHRLLFGRKDIDGRAEFVHCMRETVKALSFYPCIIAWTLFNEGWGQFDSVALTEDLKELDPTRLVDSASGWHDQGVGDFKSRHVYFKKYKYKNDGSKRAQILSEFGGIIYRIEGHTFSDKDFVYRKVKSEDEFLAKLKALYDNIRKEKEKGLAGCIYTQTSDVEEESNGFVTFDRKVVKSDIEKLREIISI